MTGHDAELIDELLDAAVVPSAVLMNPPYSHGVERGHDGRTGARHLRSAWNRLASGGRLVAIMPEWFDCVRFLAGAKGPVSLRLNAAVERAFVRQGTGITTRLLVFDKVEDSHEPVAIRTNDFRQLVDIVDALPDRAILDAVPEQSSLPARAPFRLVAVPRRPLPTPARITPPASAIGSLTYQSLETPARLAPQVGHYLPYRPSRIVIDGAAEHPTPLVESVAMGSIAAPRAIECAGRELLMVKRSLVNGSQRIELTGWSAARLDWYKAQGCFTEIIRYQTRLFVPIEGAASVIARLASSA